MIRLSFDSAANFGNDLITAEQLIRLGARPPIVSTLCNLSRKLVIRIYKNIHQQAPKQGMLPYDTSWIVRSTANNIHASIFLGIRHDLSILSSPADLSTRIFITAYELYGRVIAKTPPVHNKTYQDGSQSIPLDINRAWFLSRQLDTSDIQFKTCYRCQVRYLGIKNLPTPFYQCPICDVWTDRSGRRRWTTVKSQMTNLKTNKTFG